MPLFSGYSYHFIICVSLINTCAGTINFASAQLCRMDDHLPDARVLPASSPPSLQDLLLESQASRDLSSIFVNNEASDIPGPYPGRPVFDLNTPVYLPSGNHTEDMDIMQTNSNTDEVTSHSDLLSQAVQEIKWGLSDFTKMKISTLPTAKHTEKYKKCSESL